MEKVNRRGYLTAIFNGSFTRWGEDPVVLLPRSSLFPFSLPIFRINAIGEAQGTDSRIKNKIWFN